jgi:hypothetical protein
MRCVHSQGPVDDALPFLESCGFKCPEHKDKASFMQEVTSPIGQIDFATDVLRSARNIPPRADLEDIIKGKQRNPYTGTPPHSNFRPGHDIWPYK